MQRNLYRIIVLCFFLYTVLNYCVLFKHAAHVGIGSLQNLRGGLKPPLVYTLGLTCAMATKRKAYIVMSTKLHAQNCKWPTSSPSKQHVFVVVLRIYWQFFANCRRSDNFINVISFDNTCFLVGFKFFHRNCSPCAIRVSVNWGRQRL